MGLLFLAGSLPVAGVFYSFQISDNVGKGIVVFLILASVWVWTIMLAKHLELLRAERLDRDFSARWTKDALAMEEATAELTASFLLADLGIAHDPRPDHAAYIASWLQVLKNDSRAIFTAASKAQAAADWMHAQQP